MSDDTVNGGDDPDPRPKWDIERYKVRYDEAEDDVDDGVPSQRIVRKGRPETATYSADGWVLFWMALRTAFLSILTVGIYRFWMLTRLRRHYWSGIQILGDPLEYTGRGIEKLLGFLLAMVFLAVYLGLFNLGLTYVGLSLSTDDPLQAQLIVNLSIFATLPLIFFAQYRAMRYLLSRTRWRGIRFGMGGGSWGYMVRAVLLTALTLVTAGLAYPYQHFKLAQYMTNRSWFGDMKFEQNGSWWDLFASWIWIYIMLIFIALAFWTLSSAGSPDGDTMSLIIAGVIYFVAIIVLYLTIVRYRFQAFKSLWSHRSLNDVTFDSELDVGDAVKVYLSGSIITGFAAAVTVGVASGAIAGLYALWGIGSGEFDLEGIAAEGSDPTEVMGTIIQAWPFILSVVVTYLLVIAVVFAVSQVFFTHRILRRQVSTMKISDPRTLALSQQRAHDQAGEAGGFADALGVDVGAGF
ncbi:MAG: DUF898 family protein [Pseudomonadota bacterium]